MKYLLCALFWYHVLGAWVIQMGNTDAETHPCRTDLLAAGDRQ